MAKYNRYKNNRTDEGYEDFRKSVLKRDRYTCQMPGCGYRVRRFLQVHHIVPYSKNYALRTDPKNGVVLCFNCHKSIKNMEHTYAEMFHDIVKRNLKK